MPEEQPNPNPVPEGDGTPEQGKTIGDIMKDEGLIKEPEVSAMSKDDKGDFSEVFMRIDKIEGRIEALKERDNAFTENLLDIKQNLGDIRRMVMDREKASTKMDGEFERVRMTVKELEPQLLVRRFEKFNTRMDKTDSLMERTKDVLNNFKERIRMLEDKISKIKNLENLANVTSNINSILKEVKENKRYTDRLASKVESIFSETNKKMMDIKKDRELISKVDEISMELMKELDRLKFKIEQDTVKPKEIEGLKESIVNEIEGINPNAFEKLKRRVGLLETEMKDVKQLQSEKTRVKKLLDVAKEDFRKGKIDQKSYNELKGSCETKLKEINRILYRRGFLEDLPEESSDEDAPEVTSPEESSVAKTPEETPAPPLAPATPAPDPGAAGKSFEDVLKSEEEAHKEQKAKENVVKPEEKAPVPKEPDKKSVIERLFKGGSAPTTKKESKTEPAPSPKPKSPEEPLSKEEKSVFQNIFSGKKAPPSKEEPEPPDEDDEAPKKKNFFGKVFGDLTKGASDYIGKTVLGKSEEELGKKSKKDDEF